MKKFNKLLLTSASAALLLGAAGQANAAGFFIQEQSVSGLGSSFAGQAAQPRDASILFFNPAGATYLEGGNVNVGVHVLVPDSELTDTGTTLPPGQTSEGDGGNPYDPTPVPNAYITKQLTDQFWIGFGISAPFGLSNEYDEGWFGRYDSTETSLTTTDFTPSAAYKINDWLSIGGSMIVQTIDADLKAKAFQTAEGERSLTGTDVSMGYNVGVLAEPWHGTRVGLDYRSEIHHELEGRLTVQGSGGADTNLAANAEITLPDIATLSVAHDLNPQWTLLGSATWFGWNDYEQIQAKFPTGFSIGDPVVQNYQSTWAFSVGAEYMMNDAWTFRAGYQFDETPTTDEYRTSRTPDGDRHWFSAGTTYTMNDKWSLDLAATYIDIAEEEISLSRNSGFSQVRADTDGHVAIVGVGVNYKF